MLRILRQRRWVGFSLLAIFFLLLFVRLGIWQISRLHEREAANAVTESNMNTAPADWATASGRFATVASGQEWTRVSVTGHWDDQHSVFWRSRVLNGDTGYEVITPLVPASGPALLVDRGWIPSGSTADAPGAVPAAQLGTVTVVASVHPTQPARTSSFLVKNQVLAINATSIGSALGYPVVDGYGQLVSETPQPSSAPTILDGPVIDDGPHLSYAIQWFLFACVAVVGWWVYVRQEAEEQDKELADAEADDAAENEADSSVHSG